MTVADYNETPFARRPRMHHKDALEGPSSAPLGRRNLVGLMGVMMGSGAKAWSNPYVTIGLIAMWDGEWNAGGGKHDANATEWTDLSGHGRTLTLPSSWSVKTNFLEATDNKSMCVRRSDGDYEAMVAGNGYTVEIVANIASGTGSLAAVGNNSLISIYSDELYRVVVNGKYQGNGTDGTLYGHGTTHALNSLTIAVTVNGPTVRFLNGVKETISTTAGGIQGNQYPQFVGFAIHGAYQGDNSGPASGGKYYSVRIYSRPLTDTEAAANYAVDKARFGLT